MRAAKLASILLIGCLAALGGEVSARRRTVVGGTASGSYVYTGDEQSIFFEGVSHDARFEAGGLLGVQHLRAGEELSLALFGGGLAAARTTSFRNALARGELDYLRVLTRRALLEAGLQLDLRPVSSAEVESTAAPVDLRGTLALLARPLLRTTLELAREDDLRLTLAGRVYSLLRSHSDLKPDQVGLALGVEPEASWRHRFSRIHSLLVDARARLHQNRLAVGALTSVVGGLLAGYGLRWRDRFWLEALFGGEAIYSSLAVDYLSAVLPTARFRGELRGRLDVLRIEGAWTVEQNYYGGGLPQRAVTLSVAHRRIPTWRPVRWSVGVDYKYASYAMLALGDPAKPLDQCSGCVGTPISLHAGRVAGRLYLSLGRWWRAVAELTATLGRANLEGPHNGVHLTALLGLACLYDERPEDEVLLRDVW